MIIDANTVGSGSTLEADICIVGSGAAGISMALALSGHGLKILVLEGGKRAYDASSQALYEGEVADEKLHSPPDKYRHRRFGGATAIWGGRCMPFDPIDFEARAYVPLSGWPISYDDLLPFYREANRLAEAGPYEYSADRVFGPQALPMFEGFRSSRVSTDGIERFSIPTDFSRRYQARLEHAADITLLLGANCTELILRPDGAGIRGVEVATLEGVRFSVAAGDVVVAVGGLETARLLLASGHADGATGGGRGRGDGGRGGIGNEHDVVGRYYMCHIAGNVGTLTIQGSTARVRHGYEISPEGIYCRRRLSLTAETQRAIGAANMVARLHFPRITDPSHRNPVLSGLFVARRLISYEYSKRLKDGEDTSLAVYLRHLRNIALGPVETLGFLRHWITRRTLAERKFPSIILQNRTNRFSLEVHGEQLPNPDSRVTLSDAVDALGMPKIKVDWRYAKEDIEAVRKTLDVFAEEFRHSGTGTFEYDGATLEADLTRFGAYGGHHIGTARMGTDPRTSVVDSDCKVHSMDNLHIAGSAVFPTSSQANPTLTLIAVSLRLARHLLRKHRPGTTGEPVSGTKEVPA